MLDKLKSQLWSISSLLSGLLFFLIYSFKSSQYRSMKLNLIETSNFKLIPLWAGFVILSFIFYKLAANKDEKGWIKRINYWVNPYFYGLVIFYFIGKLFPPILGFGAIVSILFVILKVALVIRMQMNPYKNYMEEEASNEEEIRQLEVNPGDFVIGSIYKRNLNENGETPDDEDDYIPADKTAIVPLRDRFVHVLALGVTGSGKTSQSLLPMFNQDFSSDNFRFAEIDVVQMGQIVLEPKGDFAKATWAMSKIKEIEKKNNYIAFLLDIDEKIVSKLKDLAEKRESYLNIMRGVTLSKEELKELKYAEKLLNNQSSFKKLSTKEQIDIRSSFKKLSEKQSGRELIQTEENERLLNDDSIRNLLMVRSQLPNYLTLEYDWLDKLTPFALFRYASILTDIIANPAKIDESWNLFIHQSPQEKRDLVMLFDPSAKNSLRFNPLFGPEDTAIATIKETLISFMDDSASFFKNSAETLLQKAIKVVKRVHGNDATLLHLDDILTNNNGRGDDLLRSLSYVKTTNQKARENQEIASWFQTEYYAGLKGLKTGGAKTWENTSGIRSILANLLDSKRIRNVLCPPPGVGSDLNFDEILRTGDKVAISTSTGLSDKIGGMLGSFLMLQLQAAILRRPGNENTRTPVILYIDEFQDYANPNFEAVLTKGRSYCVSATMATQTLGIVSEKAGDGLVQNIQSNARNVIVYPGASESDADYFMKRFGTVESFKVKTTLSKEKDRYKIDEIKTQLGLNDAPRESISEEVKEVDRFTKGQIMFGPNYRRRGIGSNDSFGYIYYMIIIHNSPQPPSVAKINYIPRDLKVASDRLVAAYDNTNRLVDLDEDNILDNESQVDPLKKETKFKDDGIIKLNNNLNSLNESDPMSLSRGLSGNNQSINLNNNLVNNVNSNEDIKLEKIDLNKDFSTKTPDFNNINFDNINFDNLGIDDSSTKMDTNNSLLNNNINFDNLDITL